MKRSLHLLAFALAVVLLTAPGARAQHADEAGVRRAVEHYLQGHATGDPAHFRAAFHPEAKLFWMRDGALQQRTSEAYIAGAKGTPAPDEAQRRRRIVSIDVYGDAAVAKVELDYPTAYFIDYLSLLKTEEDAWKIVNKIFHVQPKPAPAAPGS